MPVYTSAIPSILMCSIGRVLLKYHTKANAGKVVIYYSILYWWMPAFLTLYISGASFNASLACSFAMFLGTLVPYSEACEFKNTSDLYIDLSTVFVRTLVIFWPISIMSWLYRLCWWPLIIATFVIPLVYLIGSLFPSKFGKVATTAAVGATVGFALTLTATIPVNSSSCCLQLPSYIHNIYQ